MTPISSVSTGAAQALTPAKQALGTPGARPPEEKSPGHPPRPAMDRYVPEEPREPSGRYWLGRDEDGRPKICFDGPERAADAPDPEDPNQSAGAKRWEKTGQREGTCTGNTDKVDREIEKLKRKREELERRLHTETDEARRKELERQLAQVARELDQKDNDAYRRRHSAFT